MWIENVHGYGYGRRIHVLSQKRITWCDVLRESCSRIKFNPTSFLDRRVVKWMARCIFQTETVMSTCSMWNAMTTGRGSMTIGRILAIIGMLTTCSCFVFATVSFPGFITDRGFSFLCSQDCSSVHRTFFQLHSVSWPCLRTGCWK